MSNIDFDDIRPYHDEELPLVFEELISDDNFRKIVSSVMPNVPFEIIAHKIRQCKTKFEFQKTFCYGLIKDILKKLSTSTEIDISDIKEKEKANIYISNHRDIILDSGILSVLLVDEGLDTVEIAIGDNLLIYPWIKKLVRINKSFIVKRGINIKQILEASTKMSHYIHHTIKDKNQSIWIAQREGRSKDSDDRTQESILKMLSIGGDGSIKDKLKSLRISPMAISYEYDPCDFLKVKEFILKKENSDYKKSQQDDLINMKTGLYGYKGDIRIKISNNINEYIDSLPDEISKQELFSNIAERIDKEIHKNYHIYNINRIAYDMLYNSDKFSDKYTNEEKERFKEYILNQMSKVDINNFDKSFAMNKFLEMYSNPLKNHLIATGQCL